MRKIGLIQSRGLGDIIIALPIARHFAAQGWHVVWPIDRQFLPSFQPAAPYVEFLPIEFTPDPNGYLLTPMRLLKAANCERIVPLYSHLTNTHVADATLFHSLKFDEYKYAITGVPFREKWNLHLVRNPQREQALYERVVRADRFAVRHLTGSNCQVQLDDPLLRGVEQVIDVGPLTDSIFDWLLVLEKASALVMIDSCFSNLVDQLGFDQPKTFILRSDVRFTPVLRGAWTFRSVASRPAAKPAVAQRG